MGRDTIQIKNAVSTISQEYLLEFTFEYGIPESLHPELHGPEDPIVEFPEGKVGVYTKFFEFANFYMDLFSLISAPNLAKVKTETRPRAAHEVPLLTTTTNRVIYMKDMTGASGSSGIPSTVEKSPLDFANEDPLPLITERVRTEEQVHDELSQGISPVGNLPYTKFAPELEKETVAMEALVNKRRRKRGPNKAKANAPPKVLRRDHVASHPSQSTLGGKSLAAIGIGTGSTVSAPTKQETPVHAEGVSDPNPLSYAKPRLALSKILPNKSSRKAVVTEDSDFEKSASFTSMVGSPRSRRWVIGNGLRLAIMKCAESTKVRQVFANVMSAGIAKGMSEGLKHVVEHRKAKVNLAAIETYEPEADTKYVAALHVLKDLKYPLVDQLEKLKHAPIDVIMSSLFLESDSGEDAPQWIRKLHPSSSQLKIPVYPEVHNPKDPWSFKEDILLEDAIVANISRAKKKKKRRVVCRTHGVGFAHHARSDGIPVSVLSVAPQGLAILLADAATQTEN
nr:hypothetical protein [Tanacetum cinerariifolium]